MVGRLAQKDWLVIAITKENKNSTSFPITRNHLFFWNRNHIIYVDNLIVFYFDKIYTFFHFLVFGLKRRQWCKIIKSVNLQNSSYIFSSERSAFIYILTEGDFFLSVIPCPAGFLINHFMFPIFLSAFPHVISSPLLL